MPFPTFSTYSAYERATGLRSSSSLYGVSADRIERVWPAPHTSSPFRTGYFTVALIESGRGRYTIDGVEYPTREGTVYFTNPGHVKAFTFDAPSTGWVLTFTEAFLKAHVRVGVFGALPFLLAETAPPFYADASPDGTAAFLALSSLAEQVAAEAGRPSTVQPQLVGALLFSLLLRFREAFWDDYDPVAEGDRSSAIVAAFQRDLEGWLRALVAGAKSAPPLVTDLADAQALHANYLSTVVKAKTGRTVGEWTAAKLAAEARGLLLDRGVAVKEVAYRLGFSEPTAFSRFFKRETGLTPSAFRRRPGEG